MLTMVDGVSMKIVHAMLVTGNVRALEHFVPLALVRTFNRHPRMRALQVKGTKPLVEIQAPLVLDDVHDKQLLRLRRFPAADSAFATEWPHYAEHECNVGFDRYSQLPFFLTLWVQDDTDQCRLLLFSDHYMSDGQSGMTVLHCILEQVSLLSTHAFSPLESAPVPPEYPLRPSVYDMWLSKSFFVKGSLKLVMASVGKAVYRSEMKKFTPLLPPRSDQHDFVVPPVTNPTSASFAEGSATCMHRSLDTCKAQGVTCGGAIVAAALLALYHAAMQQPQPRCRPGEPFKVAVDVDYNMRHRVPRPAQENQVGAFVAFTDLTRFAAKGIVEMETTRFWDLARSAKREIDVNLEHPAMMAALPVMMDQKLHARVKPSLAKAVNIRYSQTSDVNVSNVGCYPYTKEHLIASTASEQPPGLTVKSVHVYNPNPHLGPSVIMFLTSVESFCYAMAHKCSDDAANALFTAWVAICEHLGQIGPDETLTEVLQHLKL
ncbi:unnamed protein product [Hyaloperonospora brassicae]|nr:unnamed protein product [Hyaloperonospora brassicae]